MTNGASAPCSGYFYDSGGSAGNFANNEVFMYTFYPAVLGQKVQVIFSSFATEANYDGLMIYNGNSINSPLISSGQPAGSNITTVPAGAFHGTLSPGTVTSTAADGALTFVFRSDISNVAAGWQATVSCVGPSSPQYVCLGATYTFGEGSAFTLPTGGTLSTSGGDRIHTFTASGTFNNPGQLRTQVLVVAGGGGGGCRHAGGGGAGGLIYNANWSMNGNQAVTVGAGGAGSTAEATVNGGSGGNSVLGLLTAIGGGGGGSNTRAGASGGSGGGGSNGGGAGAGTAGQGNNGGGHAACCYAYGGGGGGAGAAAASVSGANGSAGGAGLSYAISGTSVFYAGGGGGGVDAAITYAGGNGGGGAGGRTSSVAGTSGTANTGGGGGGGGASGSTSGVGGNGGSGIVIVRYTVPVWSSSNPAVATVDQSGTVTPVSTGSTTITYTNQGGITLSKTVSVYRPEITGPARVCVGSTINLSTSAPAASYYYSYTSNGSFVTSQAVTAEVLLVAGGGGGGSRHGGGGGGGGVIYNAALSIPAGTHAITVGAGGRAGNYAGSVTYPGNVMGAGEQGGNSSLGSLLTAIGGGGGKTYDGGNANGGSGGGGTGTSTGAGAATARSGGTGTAGQGYAGGTGSTDRQSSGGGGGAGGVGGNVSPSFTGVSNGGAGGVGVANSITGASVFYGGGGGGAGTHASDGGARPGGVGGNGGGGHGGDNGGTLNQTAGAAGTGGGGGGCRSYSNEAGSAGGSGIVIIKYSIPAPAGTWSSSNPAVASVNASNGTVTGVAQGTAVITYTSPDGCSVSAAVAVGLPAVPVVSASASSVCSPGTTTLSATGMAPGGQVATLTGDGSSISGSAYTGTLNNHTMEFWVNPNKSIVINSEINSGVSGVLDGTGQNFAIGPQQSGGSGCVPAMVGVGVSVGTNGVSVFQHGPCHFPATLVYSAALSGWTHIAVVHIANVPHLYVNGSLVKVGQPSLYPTYPNGMTSFPYGFFSGSIDNVRIWNTARTASQIATDMFLETPTVSTGLIGHYAYNGNTNATVGSNNGNNGASFSAADYYTYTWSGGPGLPTASTSESQTTGALNTAGTHSYRVNASAAGCTGTQSSAVSVTVNTPSVAPSSVSGTGTFCRGNNISLGVSGGSLGSNAGWEWFSGSCGGTAAGTGTSISPATGGTYYVRASAAGACPATACASGVLSLPSASNQLSTNGQSATCAVSENNFVHFYESVSGNLVASVHSNGQNLGNVTAMSYVAAAPIDIQACGTTQALYRSSALGRRWVIRPSVQPASSVTVRLYLDQGELAQLITTSNANVNPTDNVAGLGSLNLSKYSNAGNPSLENGVFTDNCGSGTSSLHVLTSSGNATALFPSFNAAGRYVEYVIPGFSEFWLGGTGNVSPLPIELTAFSAVCENGRVKLSWTTASETNNAKFVLQRSHNLAEWTELTEIPGAGNSNATLGYTAYDERPPGGLSYYRLRQVDYDGQSETFTPVSVLCSPDNGDRMTVHPNPATDRFTVSLRLTQALPDAQLVIYDLGGKQIGSRIVQGQTGLNEFLFDRTTMAPGTYTIHLKSDRVNLLPLKLIVQ